MSEQTSERKALAVILQAPHSAHTEGGLYAQDQGTAQGHLWTDNRDNHTNLFYERHSDRLSHPRGLALGLGCLDKCTQVAPHNATFEQCVECASVGMCCEEPPVSTGQAGGTALGRV